MTMNDMRKLVYSALKDIHPRVYFQSAPKAAKYPYLVMDFTNVLDDGEDFRVIDLDVDGWDYSDDTTNLETLMETINQSMNKKSVTLDNLVVTFYLERILFLTDDDPLIKRRKYMYQVRAFKRE
jgi:hypothetical protein